MKSIVKFFLLFYCIFGFTTETFAYVETTDKEKKSFISTDFSKSNKKAKSHDAIVGRAIDFSPVSKKGDINQTQNARKLEFTCTSISSTNKFFSTPKKTIPPLAAVQLYLLFQQLIVYL
ncbi:hypothetical protein HCG49_10275 [Arenibacter sp. 6A1]|uniref:hypothetical protein n=1 Tax=Arenibacter sp. 6A1 TaxID=2720391 RepID=UPI0014455828|nr:hypothetical protein [Arenibacter sp. 6A1]NKI26948.1 hypothetical protein [Arenibacter sp. 6A1]